MTKISRREALKHIVAGVAFAALPTAITAMPTVSHAAHLPKYRKISGKLSFYNIHTKDSISIKYLARDGNFDFGALTDLEYVFRCHYTGKVHPIDPKLFLLLDNVKTRMGANGRRYRLISGYRSPEYNRKLARRSSAVAKNSYHLKGMAADVRLEGLSLDSLRRTAVRLEKGGVGSYSDFIHLDVGPCRCW